MLWHYPYFDHEVCRLHEQIADFLTRASAEANPPRNFSLVHHCCPELRARCESSTKLKSKLKAFYNAFVHLRPTAKQRTFAAFQAVNAIDDQLANRRQRYTLQDLPTPVREPAKKLFVFLYEETLPAGDKIADHWGKFYAQLESKDCPFCAIEPLHHPDFYKQDYDHLLCKDIYPFAAANMRNLVPAGRDCNTIFKKRKDLLFKDGARRRAFRPFVPSGVRIKIELSGSQPPTAANRKGKWKVKVSPNRQEVATWMDVFETPARYKKDVLEAKAVDWIGEFRNLAIVSKPVGGWTVQRLRGMLGRYAKAFDKGGYGDCHFLKAPFYGFLHTLGSREFLTPLLKSIK
jgi:hypothetical protein